MLHRLHERAPNKRRAIHGLSCDESGVVVGGDIDFTGRMASLDRLAMPMTVGTACCASIRTIIRPGRAAGNSRPATVRAAGLSRLNRRRASIPS
jgi:hypothetical protein